MFSRSHTRFLHRIPPKILLSSQSSSTAVRPGPKTSVMKVTCLETNMAPHSRPAHRS